jgi:lipopolysaccharide/colanic/teichoic acid biosynthesis glycosyltransferase
VSTRRFIQTERKTRPPQSEGNGTAIPVLSEGPSAVAPVGTLVSPGGLTKRTFDLFVALIALIVFAPVMLVIALVVKIDSRGPVLFRSRRIGRGGEAFGMLKFRTMVAEADMQRDDLRHLSEAPDGLFKMQNDPRLTRAGRYLRSASLDELPQLFQVLTGTMSLVGPRPLPPEEDALVGGKTIRLQARPGLTGPWQLAGSWRVPLSVMVKMDDDYLANWSLRQDLRMIGGTVRHVVRRRGV